MLSSSGGASDGPDDAGKRRREAIRAAARLPSRTLQPMADSTCRSASSSAAAIAGVKTIFISYARNDIETVAHVIERLRGSGGDVTWDQDFIGGTDFEHAICSAIDAARSVIVVWSPVSVQSPFVRDEARRALRANKLITTHIAGFDAATSAPLGFGHLHTIPVDNQELVRKSLAAHGVVLPAEK